MRYLISGSDEQYMSVEWMNTRMQQHEEWTARQMDQGRIMRSNW